MRVVILTADYQSFLKWHYMRHPGLHEQSYKEQLRARFDTLFGVSDSYSRNFALLGHQAQEIYVNNIWLQTAWAREHGIDVPDPPPPEILAPVAASEVIMKLKRLLQPYRELLAPIARRLGYMMTLSPLEKKILLAQIADINPDVILNQIPEVVTSEIMHEVKRPGRVLIVQHGNQPPVDFDASPYTFGISLIPAVVEFFRAQGLPAENRHLAFDAWVLDRLGTAPPKDIDVSFVGGLGPNHGKRIELLDAIARELPITLYLSNSKGLPKDSVLQDRVRGEVWGADMYNILRRSKITLNSHIDAAQGMAGNMRLYEATGVGTFLLTDDLANLSELFQPGLDVATYVSADDCISKIRYYLEHEVERETIARNGQRRTLAQHTYRQRVQALLDLIAQYGG